VTDATIRLPGDVRYYRLPGDNISSRQSNRDIQCVHKKQSQQLRHEFGVLLFWDTVYIGQITFKLCDFFGASVYLSVRLTVTFGAS